MSFIGKPRTPDDTVFYSIFPDDHLHLHSLHLHILTSIVPSFLPPSLPTTSGSTIPSSSPLPYTAAPASPTTLTTTGSSPPSSSTSPPPSLPSPSPSSTPTAASSSSKPPSTFPAGSDPTTPSTASSSATASSTSSPSPKTSLQTALSALKSGSVKTLASDAVQSAIKKRILEYPVKAVRNMHRTGVRVLLSVAKVLREEPCLISLAVEGFYDRDVDSMKHAMRMERFLGGGEVEMVTVAVTMSRVMYGQLVMQRFQAPRGYPMPGMKEVGGERFREAELGMKIACGFGMMYQERKKMGEEGKGETWDVFFKSLESSGAFQGLLPGSKEYKRILDAAMEYYKSSSLYSRTRYGF